jgi:hypothetical protein
MSYKTKLQIIKEKLQNKKVKIEFKTAVTAEGVSIETEGEFVEGAEVYVSATEEGAEKVLAPDGLHLLESEGIQITTENGVIIEIVMIEDLNKDEDKDEDKPSENKYQITPEEQTAIVAEVMQILDPRFAEIMNKIDNLEAMFNEGKTVSESEFNTLKTELSALKEIPGGKSKTEDEKETSKEKLSIKEKLERLQRINKLR